MTFERYKNKMEELHTQMGTIKINIDRMVLGGFSCTAASHYVDSRLVRDVFITSSIVLALGITVNSYKLYRLEKKCDIVQEMYYSKNKKKTYTINK